MKLPGETGIMAGAGGGPCWGLLGAVLAIPLLVGPVRAQQTSAQASGKLPVKAVRQIEALLAAKAQRTPVQQKVSSQLLVARRGAGVVRRQARFASAADELVTVDIRADVTPPVLARIRVLGGTVINSVLKYRTIRARLPLAALEPLATLEAVQFIQPADQPITNQVLERSAVARAIVATSKVNTTEGDVAHQANVARQTYSVDGTGIGIGVISDGVETLADQQATGDVAARVTVLPGQEGGSFPLSCGGRSSGTEGTAMLEIAHDLAPGAELYFADGGGGAAQMAQNIENLCAGGADIIVDDIGYLGASAFQDDVIAQAVSAAAGNGCYYFSAAGNGGNLNDGTGGVWEGDFAAGGTLSVNGVSFGVVHDFGGGVIGNQIKRTSTLPIVLQWPDPVGGSANDYDLFLIDADNNVLASSTNTQDGTQDPIEFIRSSCSDDYEDALLVIVKNTGAADRYLRLNYARGGLATATAGQTFGHSASQDAVGVAAVAASSDSAFDGTESVETFSSDGPRRIFFESDGTPITPGNFSSSGGKLLQKPDLAAATCVSTSTPGFSPFCGTSAAAPHAAAIAALMLEAAGGPDNVTLAALRTAMTGAALDIEATGVDRDSGAGIVMAAGAVAAVDVAVVDRNGAPTMTGTLADRTFAPGDAAVTIDVASAFSDPDNDALTYTALSSDPDRLEITLTGSMLTLTPRVPGLVVVTVRAVDSHGLSATLTVSVTVAAGTRDYDLDDDGLIAVATPAQLDAVRYDLNGDGMVDIASDWRSYYAAFAQGTIDMGCPDGCMGYELMADLDFDTNGSGSPDAGDAYWNNGAGWVPIGGDGTTANATMLFLRNPFVAIFEGNGHTVSNLFIETDTIVLAGLFGFALSSIRNVGLIDVDVKTTGPVAGLVGFNSGEIRASYVTGRVSGVENVGGLVGINSSIGEIRASYATSRVSAEDNVGGLVGDNRGAITASYATGRVFGDSDVGGLVGFNQSTGEIRASYATGHVSGEENVGGLVGLNEGTITASYWDTSTSGHTTETNGEGKTTAELQAPTSYSGIYAAWNVDLDGDGMANDPWNFGEAGQYPALKTNFDRQGTATWQEFGRQLREGPDLTATAGPTQVTLTWTPVTASHWTPAPSVTYTLTRDDGATWETFAVDPGERQYTDTDVIAGTTYTYQVAAVVTDGEATRSALVEVEVTVPISSLGLTASPGNGQVTLRWNAPQNTGGAPIVRYEYRWRESGAEFGDWMRVGPVERAVTVSNLTNGREYVFEVRGVNALGYGPVETATATPEGGGGGGGFPQPPRPPANNRPMADAGPDQTGVREGALVTLDGSGSSDPDDDPLKYRWNQYRGERVALSSRDVVNPTFTAPRELTVDVVLSFRLLVTDPGGRFDTDTVEVTVTVTDEDNENPGKPLAPTVSAATPYSLMVEWMEPENSGPAITDYDVQYREGDSGDGFTDAQHQGPARTATLTGLMPDTVYEVQVRATNATGTGDWSESGEGKTKTLQTGDQIYYFPHLAVGASWQTTITYINYSPEEVTCQTDFLSDHGSPLMVSFAELGTVDSRTDVLPPGGSVHQETNVDLSAPLAPGWALANCSGPVKASLLYRQHNSEGAPTAEAGANATAVPATRFVTFAEQGEGQFGTGVAHANPSATAALVTFTARDTAGEVLASVDRELSPGGHDAHGMAELFGLTSFTGSIEVTSTEPIVSLSLNFEADSVFSSLPPGELDASAQGSTTYYFPHLAVGASWQTTITYINYSPDEVTCQTDFISDHGTPLMVSFAALGTVVSRTDVLPPGGSVHQETNVDLNASLAPGWARANCSGPVKASLLYRLHNSEGAPTAEAGVNATAVPAIRFVTFAEQGEDQFGTGVAYANPSAISVPVTFTARDAAGEVLASVVRTLSPGGHDAHGMAELFGLTSFTGSLEVTSTEPIVSLSLNFEAAPVFSSLPPGELDASAQ